MEPKFPIDEKHFISWLSSFMEMYKDHAERKPRETRERLPLYNNFPPTVRILGAIDGSYCVALLCKPASDDQKEMKVIESAWRYGTPTDLEVNLEYIVENLRLAGDLVDIMKFNWREFNQVGAVSDYVEAYIQKELIHPAESLEAPMPKVTESANEYFVAHAFTRAMKDDLRRAVEEALEGSGLNPYYADMELREGHIFLNKILPKIKGSRFGIYDISEPAKPNVFIELGAALALRRPYIIIVKKGTEIPADLHGLDRIEYESLQDLTKQLREKVEPYLS